PGHQPNEPHEPPQQPPPDPTPHPEHQNHPPALQGPRYQPTYYAAAPQSAGESSTAHHHNPPPTSQPKPSNAPTGADTAGPSTIPPFTLNKGRNANLGIRGAPSATQPITKPVSQPQVVVIIRTALRPRNHMIQRRRPRIIQQEHPRTPNPANLTHPTVTLIQPATASTRHRELTITLNLTPIPGSHRTRPATILRHLPARRPPSKYHAALHALIRPRLSTLALPGRRHGRVRLSAGHALRNSIRVPTLDHGSAAARARGPPGRGNIPSLAGASIEVNHTPHHNMHHRQTAHESRLPPGSYLCVHLH